MAKLGGKIKEIFRKRKWKIKIKTWMLLVVLAPLLFVDATLLRYNHIKMTEFRDIVMSADAEEDDAKLAQALTNLKEFVFHDIVINIIEENGVQKVTFGTGPFYLEHLYIRDANKALEEARAQLTSDSNPHGNVYGQAAAVCDALAQENGWNWASPGYMNCMTSEIAKYPAASEIQDTMVAKLPSTELYRRNYASPVWAPSLTGVMLLITLIVIVVIFIRIIVWIVLRLSLLFI
ncbi:hypothetical protein IJG29_01060 [Candidatus Saccharibacteria bacterium]|nr:hypothetical protein [Candidatus Saccharibacteria bacterium]